MSAHRAKVHKKADKWRFRWTTSGTTCDQVITDAARLRQLAPTTARKLKPKQRDDGTWYLMWSVVRSDEMDAEAELRRYQRSTKSTPSPVTVVGAAQEWAGYRGDMYSAWVVTPIMSYDGGSDLLSDITDDWLDNYKRWIERSNYSEESQRKFVKYASSVFMHALRKRWIEHAPTPANFPQSDPEPKAYTRDELAEVYRSLRNARTRHILPMLRLMLLTGLRLAEIRQLRWEYVRLADKAIVLPGRAHKGGKVTRKSRIVPLLPAALRIFERQRGAHRKYVFVAKRTGKPYSSRHGLNSILYRGETEITPDRVVINPHRLKHTFAQRAIDTGVPPHVVTEMLGQKDSRMVWIYAKIRDETVRDAFEQATAREIVRPRRQSLPVKVASQKKQAARTSSTRKKGRRSSARSGRHGAHTA